MTSLAGRVALVTGASRGVGLAVADHLQGAGAFVVRLARSLAAAAGERHLDIPCDVTNEGQIAAAVRQMTTSGRTPDIVVNNAGAFVLKPLEETTPRDLDQQLAVNLMGPFLVIRALLPHLLHVRGHVVTIGSVADHQALPGNAAYGASKYGVRGFHEVMAQEFRGRLRATLISPGPTDTALWDRIDSDARADLPDRSTMLQPQDVAEALLFAVTRAPHANIDLIYVSPSGLG